jgi:hypothetical protein
MSIALTDAAINALPEPARSEVKALLGIKQSLYDVLGSYPLDNVLPYDYGINLNAAQLTAVPANGTAQASIKVSADAAFIATSVRGSSTGDYLLFARIDNSDRQLMNVPTHSNAFTGTGQRPAPLAKPLLLPANTTISLDITDLSGQANDVYLYFFGFKLYQRRVGA